MSNASEPLDDSRDGPCEREAKLERPAACYWVGVSLILFLLAGAAAIVVIHLDSIPSLAGSTMLRAHAMCAAFGLLGASVAATRKYYRTLITESTSHLRGKVAVPSDWTLGWVYYYLTRPLLGGILGALVYTFTFAGTGILVTPREIDFSSEGRCLLYGISFLSGFAVSHVLDTLEGAARKVFRVGPDAPTTER